MWFGSRKSKLRAVIDVGSHAIKAVLFETRLADRTDEKSVRILEKKAVRLPLQSNLLRGAREVRRLLWDTVKSMERIPAEIVVGIGSHTGKLSLETWTARPSEKSSRLDKKMADKYFENLMEQHRSSGEALVVYPIQILVNRYPVILNENVFAEEIRELQFRVLVQALSAEVGRLLADAKRSLGGMPVEFVPLAAALEEAFSHDAFRRNALLVDIGGEETSLTLIREGHVIAYAAFLFGARNFIRGIARRASLPFHEAEDLMRQSSERGVAGDAGLGGTLEEIAGQWRAELTGALGAFYTAGPLPQNVCLFGGGANIPEIKKALSVSGWMEKYSNVSSPSVRVIRAEAAFEGNTFGGALSGPEDVGLASLLWYSLHHKPLL